MKNYYYLIFGIVALALIIIYRRKIQTTMTTIKSKLPRGLRNNNPGNIRLTPTYGLWQGEVIGKDKSFKTFVSMEYGYRAIFVLLRSYINKEFNTIRKIINRYAPPTENVTSRYVKHVSERTGIDPDKVLTFNDTKAMKDIVAAISWSENGVKADLAKVNSGFNLV